MSRINLCGLYFSVKRASDRFHSVISAKEETDKMKGRSLSNSDILSSFFHSANKACPAWPSVIVKLLFCVLSHTLISQHSPGSGSQSAHMSDSLTVFHWAGWGVASQSQESVDKYKSMYPCNPGSVFLFLLNGTKCFLGGGGYFVLLVF